MTTRSNCLVRFSRSSPENITPIGTVTGTGGAVVGLDFRPASGELFALTSLGELLLVDPMTGETQPVTSSIGELDGPRLDIDFNPAANALRLISDARQNFRMGPGALEVNAMEPAIVDGVFGYLQGVVATAYDNVNPDQDGTRMFVIDESSRKFYQQQPNEGLLQFIGELFPEAESVQVKGYNVFTASDGSNEHYAVFAVDGEIGLYTLDPDSAGTQLLRTLPEPPQVYLDLTVDASEDGENLRAFTLYTQNEADEFFLNIFELDPSMPGNGAPVAFEESQMIAGLEEGDILVGFDLRTTSETEAENTRYALGDSGILYSIDADALNLDGSAEASEVGTLSEDLVGNRFDIDFNPRADLLRIIGDAGQNLRVNLDENREINGEERAPGFALVDGTVRLQDTREPIPVAVGYRPVAQQTDGPAPTLDFQYVIDARTSALARVAVPNDGALVAVGDRLMEGLTLPTGGQFSRVWILPRRARPLPP